MHKRAHERFSPRSTIRAVNTLDGRALGVLVNISSSGFMLISEEDHPTPGSIHQLQLVDLGNQELSISLGATCLWQEEASASNSYWSGFQIIDISDNNREQLIRYLKTLNA